LFKRIIYHLIKPQKDDPDSPPIQGKPFDKFIELNGLGAIYRYIDSNDFLIRMLILEIVHASLKNDNDSFKQNFVDMGGLGALSKTLDHWYSRIRQLALRSIIHLLRSLTGLDILQSELILNLASILRYIQGYVELSFATEIINDISILKDDQEHNIHLSLLENGVVDSLLDILDKDQTSEEPVEFQARNMECAIYCLSSLVTKAMFQPILLQDHSLLTFNKILKHPEPNFQERAAWTLSELSSLNEYACYYISTTSIITNIMSLLKSTNNTVVTSALRVVLSIARKPSYHSYLIKPDPTLAVLRSLQDHELPNVQTVATKLVNILSR